jgi:hypothetical protein
MWLRRQRSSDPKNAYFIRNNYEFSGPRAFREGVSIGYTFRSEQ